MTVGWSNNDIGSVGAAGSSTQTTNSDGTVTFTVKGSGADIWDIADGFQFDYQSLTGDGTITARVVSQTPTDPWAKAGVMIRETLAANSTHALVAITPSNGVAFQRRTTTGGQTSHTYGPVAVAPYWLRLVRKGNTFSAYASADGTAWTLIGQSTITMAANVFVGLAVTAHNAGTLSTATFDHVVTPSSIITGVTFDWTSMNRNSSGQALPVGSDNWPATWSSDDDQYAMWGDGGGFTGSDSDGRSSLGVARIEGDSGNYKGFNAFGGKAMTDPGDVSKTTCHPATQADGLINNGDGGKSHGAPLSFGGVLYAWITPKSGVTGYDSFSLYKSMNRGCDWTQVGVTFDRAHYGVSFAGFVQFGKDNNSAIDSYLYILVTSVPVVGGNTTGLDVVQIPGRVMLLRVPAATASIEKTDKSDYEFFGGLVSGQPTWVSQAAVAADNSKAKPIYEDDDGVGPFPQMSYVPGLGRFVYTNQHGAGGAPPSPTGFQSLLTMAEAPRPWGPWTEIYRGLFAPPGEAVANHTLFQWNFAPKWFREGDGKFTLIFSGGAPIYDSWNAVDGLFIVSP
ncbi:MAG TPA: hypothetical protein VMV37_03055 [Gammaproteobacteria bacterium]|nr:hypothetical protein [Gammaproteobacteria bacterium]